jgi:hypothetical protein
MHRPTQFIDASKSFLFAIAIIYHLSMLFFFTNEVYPTILAISLCCAVLCCRLTKIGSGGAQRNDVGGGMARLAHGST